MLKKLCDSEKDSENHKELSANLELREIVDIVKHFFLKYDTSRDGSIDESELSNLLSDLYLMDLPTAKDIVPKVMKATDESGDGQLSFEELLKALSNKDTDFSRVQAKDTPRVNKELTEEETAEAQGLLGGGEEEEIPEDLAELSPEEQQAQIKFRSAWMMTLGTVLVLLFSDPMVDVLSAFGNAVGMGPFYASFILAPIASNASEILSAYNYGIKKTCKTMTISLSTLQGAACMNNTFCLGIFLALMYFKKLTWEFSAETISILAVEILMAYMSLRQIHRLFDALIVFLAFPLSLVLVAVLEKIGLN
jgi:Ca2+-binding EF-hand superfamily protein